MPSDGSPIEVAVIIVCHNGKRFLDDCIGSLLRHVDPDIVQHIVIVDNGSTDGSTEHITKVFPDLDLVRLATNHGFTGGNNAGWQFVRRQYRNTSYLYLLNQDTIVTADWLSPVVKHLQQHPHVGAAQSKLMLHPNTNQINTAGNRSHFLGFGYMRGFGQIDQGQYDRIESIDYASGAAVLYRAGVLEQVGLFEDEMFLYLEDAALSWKLRQIGYDTHLVPASVIYHKYNLRTSLACYEHLERNRWWLLLVYYRVPTLLLLSPALFLMELGQWVFALSQGLTRDKWRSYGYFIRWSNRAKLWQRRQTAQARRQISDQEFMTRFAGTIDFPPINRGLFRYVANPILSAYWAVVRRLIFW